MQPSLFIGLVTHPRSRFPNASGPSGLASTLTHEMRSLGWDVTCSIAAENEIDESEIDLSRSAVVASIRAELGAERRWVQLHSHKEHGVKDSTVYKVREFYRRWKYTRPSSRSANAGRDMLMRLANIEASHLRLMRAATHSGAQWVLILEDDAFTANAHALAQSLHEHLSTWDDRPQPAFVNISRSFSLDELHLGFPLTDEGPWDDSARVFSAPVPFTNTVCAILYRATFLADLIRELDAIPMQPIVPIDWKLNLAVMSLVHSDYFAPADCYVVEPAPILQGSMHQQLSDQAAG